MSYTSIAVDPTDQFKVRVGQYGHEEPVDDHTHLSIAIGLEFDAPRLQMNEGEWRKLISAVEAAITDYPQECARRREHQARMAERREQQLQSQGAISEAAAR